MGNCITSAEITGIFLTSVSFRVFTIFRQKFHFQEHATSGRSVNNILNQKWMTRAGRAQGQPFKLFPAVLKQCLDISQRRKRHRMNL